LQRQFKLADAERVELQDCLSEFQSSMEEHEELETESHENARNSARQWNKFPISMTTKLEEEMSMAVKAAKRGAAE
uniref:Uncharacterized protein n=1 Tax=Amphimedon queenslandica TaxID=400682 RepID=A0A1X7SDS9_AMPQE